jgi:hypothetical protein
LRDYFLLNHLAQLFQFQVVWFESDKYIAALPDNGRDLKVALIANDEGDVVVAADKPEELAQSLELFLAELGHQIEYEESKNQHRADEDEGGDHVGSDIKIFDKEVPLSSESGTVAKKLFKKLLDVRNNPVVRVGNNIAFKAWFDVGDRDVAGADGAGADGPRGRMDLACGRRGGRR